jgi:hypothetical protein
MNRYRFIAVTSSILWLGALHAQTVVVKDDFNTGIHEDWTRVNETYFKGPVQYLSTNGAVRIVAPSASEALYAGGGYSYFVTYRTNLIYSDFHMALDVVQVPVTASSGVGLQARMQGLRFTEGNLQVSATGSGYILLTYPVPDDFSRQVLELNRGENQVGSPEFTLRTSFPRVPGRQYRLVFTGRGDHLIGQIFDRENPSKPLATVQGHDGKYTSGTVGVVGLSIFGIIHAFNEPLDVTFDNFAVSTPEPVNSFTEDFDDGRDENAGYARYDLFGSLGAAPAQFTMMDGAMRIAAPASVAPQISGAYAGGTLSTPSHDDVETSVDFWGWNESPSARPVIYLNARGRDRGDGTYDFYALNFSPTSFPEATGGFTIHPHLSITKTTANVLEIPSLANAPLTNLTLSASTRYRLTFSVQGDSLRGWLFDLSDLNKPLAEISARDGTFSSGYVAFITTDKGVVGMPSLNTPLQLTVDNFNVRGSLEGPSLTVEPAVILTWPTSASGYLLQGAPGVDGPWTDLGIVPTAVEGTNVVTMKASGRMNIHRLRRPFIND